MEHGVDTDHMLHGGVATSKKHIGVPLVEMVDCHPFLQECSIEIMIDQNFGISTSVELEEVSPENPVIALVLARIQSLNSLLIRR